MLSKWTDGNDLILDHISLPAFRRKKKLYSSALCSGRLMKNKILCRCASPINKSPHAVTIANRMYAFLVLCSRQSLPHFYRRHKLLSIWYQRVWLRHYHLTSNERVNIWTSNMCVISLARSSEHPCSWIACPSSRLQSWVLFGWTQSTHLRHKLEAG